MSELVDLGPCPTCGYRRWRIPVCTCGHMVTAHAFGTGRKASVRTGCTHYRCECKAYREEALSA